MFTEVLTVWIVQHNPTEHQQTHAKRFSISTIKSRAHSRLLTTTRYQPELGMILTRRSHTEVPNGVVTQALDHVFSDTPHIRSPRIVSYIRTTTAIIHIVTDDFGYTLPTRNHLRNHLRNLPFLEKLPGKLPGK